MVDCQILNKKGLDMKNNLNKESFLDDLIKKFPKLDHLMKKPETIIHMDFEHLQKIVNK
tara:strand:- start:40 stop:216 length:177 start_codon:yes stop_codon:yes gene_type:complete